MASSSSRLSKINFIAGFHQESTQYSEEGKWYEGDRVRFREGKPENLRGYRKHEPNPLLGTSRDLISWISVIVKYGIIYIETDPTAKSLKSSSIQVKQSDFLSIRPNYILNIG